MPNYSKPKIAICYDFDKTLAPYNMQEYGFTSALNIENDDFWDLCADCSAKNRSDRILSYMYMMKKTYQDNNLLITKDALFNYGKKINYFPGVESWFDRINTLADNIGVEVEHYILSSGIYQMIKGTSISKYFKAIFACEYIYDDNGVPIWPALAVNYTNKTQFLYRINKGLLDPLDDSVNESMEHNLRPIPFSQIIYIGDSQTDIPCMRLVMKNGGTAVGVYGKINTNKGYLKKLITNNKINYIFEADYRENSEIENLVKQILQKIKCANNLLLLNQKQRED